MEAIAATARRPDPELTYPNNYYGYGEIDAEAGLQYLFDKFGETDRISLTPALSKGEGVIYDLSGRRIANGQRPMAKGIYIVNGKKVLF